ncbi:MAG TPA: phosphoribosyl-ATP diphosphatase [Magnetospirillaceae bacterium]
MNKVVGKIVPISQALHSRAPSNRDEIETLFEALGGGNLPVRTQKLSSATIIKKSKKLVEEASEMSFEAVFGRRRGVIEESADLIYHMVVLWRSCGVKPEDIWKEMRQRAEEMGVAQKLPKRDKKKSAKVIRA